MVSPVTGGLQQQIPAANTFQPGGSVAEQQARQPDREPRTEEANPSGTETARSQSSETRNLSRSEETAYADPAQDSGGVTASSSRGTTLDITV